MKKQDKSISLRQAEIANQFVSKLDKHLDELLAGQVETAYEINEFADLLFINPNHLSDTIKDVLGKSPCAVYEEKLVIISKDLIVNTNKPISEIARILDYDPSNFTKFFKRFTGKTPKEFRNENHAG
ncbi:helix-turn-helix domain-containing protein [Chryseobacterium herbae]|uniref:AraC family transcriptional regulator n=1 Tax=Chryseobacterium herbae TaxID=2976476 RepID=A0ABT2IZ95_9FLAO|nr:AraC family transcriptional regulator [Chryseobacterium sp. pc1-10]MCT2564164.1 AraC family transcriptional regulator [Chryseobacterium sp. pc1-10]